MPQRGQKSARFTLSTAVTTRQRGHALSRIFGRYHRPHVIGQFAVMLAEAQIQLSLRRIRRQLPDQIAFGSESLKPLQFGFKVGHDAPPLMAIKGTRLRLQFTSQLTSLSDRTNLQPRRYAGGSRNHCLLMRQRTSPLRAMVPADIARSLCRACKQQEVTVGI